MTTTTPKLAQERIAALPAPLQEALFSTETSDIIHDIGEKFVFSYPATADLAEVVGLALMGFIHPDSVKDELAARIQTTDDILAGATMQIQDRILNRFRGLLVNAFYSEPGNSPKTAGAEEPMPIGEIPSIPAAVEEIPVLVVEIPSVPAAAEEVPAPATAKNVDFTAPSIVSDVRPAKTMPAASSWDTTANSPEVTAQPQFMMEDIQAQASPLVQAAGIPQQAPAIDEALEQGREVGEITPPAPEAPPAPFIMREEAQAEPPMGDINIGSAFGVDSSDQFKKDGPAETPDKPRAAEVEFGNSNTVSAVDYSSFAPEGDAPPPPPPLPEK